MRKKNKKKYNMIKLLPIKENCISYKKKFIEVYKIQLNDIDKIVKSINTGYYKFLLNFNKNLCYFFKYADDLEIDFGELLNKEEIIRLYKSFFTDEKLNIEGELEKVKHKVIRKEIAPYEFEVNTNNIKIDKGYYKLNVVERIEYDCNYKMNEILKNEDAWVSIEFRKMDQDFLLNTIVEMQQDGYIDKNIRNGFIKRNIEKLKTQLKEEKIVQCEFKILLSNKRIEDLEAINNKILIKLKNRGIHIFKIQEKLNVITAFNSTIYPYEADRMGIIQSLEEETFIQLLTYNNEGSEINENCRATC